MQEPFIGTVIVFGGSFAPVGWLTCDGSLQAIEQYQALYALIGTTYGGDGQSTFGLPDLRGRMPLGMGLNYSIGQAAGSEQVTLTAQTMPMHAHQVNASNSNAGSTDPTNNFLGTQTNLQEYIAGSSATSIMNGTSIAASQGGQPHANIMPSMAMNYIIATDGIFPPRN